MQTWNERLSRWSVLWLVLAAILSFHLAYAIPNCQVLLLVFFHCLFCLANVRSGRIAFYIGFLIGLAIYIPHLRFFWTLFQSAAIPLWVVLSFWLGLFTLVGWACLRQFGIAGWACAAPLVWMGLEYFRSELYYLRFSWLNAGYAFSDSSALPYVSHFGVYGIGFVMMALAAIAAVFGQISPKAKVMAVSFALLLVLCPFIIAQPKTASGSRFRATGVQLEFPSPSDVIVALNQAAKRFPETDLFVLSEYTFMGPVPDLAKKWCRKNHKYLVAGGEELEAGTAYYNTAFVIGPTGEIVFQQAKRFPVQFMKDGTPALSQRVWDSPWGKLGFGICYDASYTCATDELIRQGAEGLLFPTMDTEDWGADQHKLHGRIAPMRAAEYGVPVFRLCSSGISQSINQVGQVTESAPFPGQGEIVSANINLNRSGRIPPDRWLAKSAVGFTGLLIILMSMERARVRFIASVTQSK